MCFIFSCIFNKIFTPARHTLSATRAICSPGVPTSSPYMGTGIIQSMVIIQLSRYFSPLNVPDPHPCLVQPQLKIKISLQSSFLICFRFMLKPHLHFMLSKVYILILYFLSMSESCDIQVRCPECSICHLYRNHHPDLGGAGRCFVWG